ncbi:hypothetical protein G7054_g8123 [Neopestalotiopsis clavispora]|nr:hypothetical protein G7054_g8123 [Neopestalotiopsis clavispora]
MPSADPVGLPLRRNPDHALNDSFHAKPWSYGKPPVASSDFPVKDPKDLRHSHKTDGGDNHLRDDITDIGTQLNSVNNDLYHVLNELLNRPSGGFEHTFYNLRAKDYNAALPDRQHSIKPLKNPITGKEHDNFFRLNRKEKLVPITIEDLEQLPSEYYPV